MVIKDNSFSNSLHRLGDVLDRCSGVTDNVVGRFQSRMVKELFVG